MRMTVEEQAAADALDAEVIAGIKPWGNQIAALEVNKIERLDMDTYDAARQNLIAATRRAVTEGMPCYRQWNQTPKALSCLMLKRLREEGPRPFTATALCPVCEAATT